MEYDKEFENFWDKSELPFKTPKEFAYLIWQSSRAQKPEKQTIELQGGKHFVSTGLPDRQSGRERKTEEDAKKAAQAMRKRDRLAAFVYEHCGFEEEWGEQCNNYIYIDDGEYFFVQEDEFQDLCKQYMPESTAIWLCEKLNSGEIVL